MQPVLRIRFKDKNEGELLRLKDFAGEVLLADANAEKKNVVKVQVLRAGAWEHPWYGPMIISQQTLSDMVRNFKQNVKRQDLPADYYHDSEGEAAGWFKDLYLSENGQELWSDIEVTPKCLQMLSDKAIRYFSADFYFDFTDPETGVSYKNVLNGGGFVNRPFVKGMKPVTELSEGKTQMTLEEAKKKLQELSDAVTAKEGEVKTLGETVKAKDLEIAELKGKVALAAKEKEEAEKLAKFEKLCSEGKACAAQKDAFMSGDMLKFAELAQALNTTTQGDGGADDKSKKVLSEDEKKICKSLGLTEEDYLKYGK